MSIPNLPVFLPGIGPTANVQPFTYRDGVTYLEKLELLTRYITRTLTPYIEQSYKDILDAIIGNSVVLQDAVMAALLEDEESETYEALAVILDQIIKEKPDDPGVFITNTSGDYELVGVDAESNLPQRVRDKILEDAIAGLVNDYAAKSVQVAVETGRLSVATLDARFGGLSSEVDAVDAALTILEDTYNATVVNGRLSAATIDSRFNGTTATAIAVKNGAFYPVGLFQYLQTGIFNVNQDTRVAVVGDSHASGGYSTHSEQDVVKRLAYRAGAATVGSLDTLNGAVSPAGMVWYNGAVGGADSNGYVDANKLTRLNHLDPHYVIHIIGANDAANGISLSQFRTNVANKVAQIEAQTPGVINVLVHTWEPGYFTPAIPWDSYGEEMAAIAAANPTKRVYINADEAFKLLGMRSNRAGMFNGDLSHLNANGNRWFADVLGSVMGIPSESEFAPRRQDYTMTVNGGNYTVDAFISNVLTIPAANYPRFLTVQASVFITAAGDNTEVWVSRTAPVPGEIRKFRTAKTGDAHVNINTTFYIPSKGTATVVLAVQPNGNIAVSPFAEYTRAIAFMEPA